MRIRLAAAAAAALVVPACSDGQKATQPPPESQRRAEPEFRVPRARQMADPECAAPIDLTPPTEVRIGGRAATQAGYKLTFEDTDADGTLILGILGPLDEDSGANLVALKKYVRFFSAQKADAIVLTGNVGETAAGIARALLTVAEAKVPVLAMAGARECRADFTNGVLEAQSKTSNVVNMNQMRAVEFPEATLVSLPGFRDPSYLGCATGCRYFESTVDEVVRIAREARNPVVLVAHGVPRGGGPQALDYTVNGGNVGDAEINRAIRQADIPFGVFSYVREAGGRGTVSPEGGRFVPEKQASKRLYLNPGPADTVGWEMNDGTYRTGMAAVIRLKGPEASYRVYRAGRLTAAEKSEAMGLDPKRITRASKSGRP